MQIAAKFEYAHNRERKNDDLINYNGLSLVEIYQAIMISILQEFMSQTTNMQQILNAIKLADGDN